MSKKAAVIIEQWKLAIFTRHLRDAGYTYDTAPGYQPGLITLTVEFDFVDKISPIIEAAQAECARSKMQ